MTKVGSTIVVYGNERKVVGTEIIKGKTVLFLDKPFSTDGISAFRDWVELEEIE